MNLLTTSVLSIKGLGADAKVSVIFGTTDLVTSSILLELSTESTLIVTWFSGSTFDKAITPCLESTLRTERSAPATTGFGSPAKTANPASFLETERGLVIPSDELNVLSPAFIGIGGRTETISKSSVSKFEISAEFALVSALKLGLSLPMLIGAVSTKTSSISGTLTIDSTNGETGDGTASIKRSCFLIRWSRSS